MEGSGSGSIHLTSGSASGRLKNMWIRIRNTVFSVSDPYGLAPEFWLITLYFACISLSWCKLLLQSGESTLTAILDISIRGIDLFPI
jgi:hypothetical protein